MPMSLKEPVQAAALRLSASGWGLTRRDPPATDRRISAAEFTAPFI